MEIKEVLQELRKMSPFVKAFSRLEEVCDFLSANEGTVSSKAVELSKLDREVRSLQEAADKARGSAKVAQVKLDSLESEYKKKTTAMETVYQEASLKAREKYIKERDETEAQVKEAIKTLDEERARLQRKVSDLNQKLQGLTAEYESLKVKFK